MRGNRKSYLIAFIFISLSLSAVFGGTIFVNTGSDYTIGTTTSGLCSLRGAILNANSNTQVDTNCVAGSSGLDEIVINNGLTVLISQSGEDDDGFFGDFDITEIVSIKTFGTVVIIDGNSISRVFDIHGDFQVTLDSLTIQNGFDSSAISSPMVAAGIRTIGSLVLNRVGFINNNAQISSSLDGGLRISAAITSLGSITATDVSFNSNTISGDVTANSNGGVCLASFYDGGIAMKFTGISMTSNTLAAQSFDATSITSGCLGFFGDKTSISITFSAASNSGTHGGVLFFGPNAKSLDLTLIGNVQDNTAVYGGVIYSEGLSGQIDVSGYSLDNNNALLDGGVLYSKTAFRIESLKSISENNAGRNGGAFYQENAALSITKGTSINSNTAGGNGGVVYALTANVALGAVNSVSNNKALNGGVIFLNTAKITQIFGVLLSNIGELSYNNASQRFSTGGVISSTSGSVKLNNITTIHHNEAYEGGVVYALNPGALVCTIDGVSNSIYNNSAYSQDGAGGVLYVENGGGVLTNIYGNISYNLAPDGDGGVIYTSGGNAVISNSSAEISYNFALEGGVMKVDDKDYSGRIENITGDIHDNIGYFDGGVMNCDGDCFLQNNIGNYYNNLCKRGCVIYSAFGEAQINDHLGNFVTNSALQSGGVADAETIVVNTVRGEFRGNLAQIDDGGVFYSEGMASSVSLNRIGAFIENIAKVNGGVVAGNGSISMNNICGFYNNSAQIGVGGIAYAEDSIQITQFSGLSGNTPDNFVSENGGVTQIQNSPLASSINVISSSSKFYTVKGIPSAGNGPYTYLWSTGATTQQTDVSTNTFSVTITDFSFCSSIAQFTIPNPIADAGVDKIVCPNVGFVLGGNPSGKTGIPNVQAPIQYLWQPLALVDKPTIANPQSRISIEQVFTLTVTDLAANISSTDTVLYRVPNITADAGPDVYSCKGTGAVIGAAVPGTVTAGYSLAYVWTPSIGLNNNREANPVADPDQNLDYRLMVTTYECPSLFAYDTVRVIALEISNPIAVASPFGSDSLLVCPGTSIELGGESTGVPGPLTYLWSPSTGLDNVTSAHPIATPTETTTYTVKVSNLADCGTAEDSITLIMSGITADAGEDFYNSGTVGGSPTASLGAAPYFYSWSPTTGLSNPTIANPLATPTNSISYTVTISDRNGCIASSSVNVILQTPRTTGELYIRYTFVSKKRDIEVADAEILIQQLFSSILNVPYLVVDTGKTTKFNDTAFSSEVEIYEWGVSGVTLSLNILQHFGCSFTNLPCNVSSNLLTSSGLEFLEFFANGFGEPVNSFSYYNSVNSILSTLYFPESSTTYTVSRSTETSVLSIVSIYSTNLVTTITSYTSGSSYSSGSSAASSDGTILIMNQMMLVIVLLFIVL